MHPRSRWECPPYTSRSLVFESFPPVDVSTLFCLGNCIRRSSRSLGDLVSARSVSVFAQSSGIGGVRWGVFRKRGNNSAVSVAWAAGRSNSLIYTLNAYILIYTSHVSMWHHERISRNGTVRFQACPKTCDLRLGSLCVHLVNHVRIGEPLHTGMGHQILRLGSSPPKTCTQESRLSSRLDQSDALAAVQRAWILCFRQSGTPTGDQLFALLLVLLGAVMCCH